MGGFSKCNLEDCGIRLCSVFRDPKHYWTCTAEQWDDFIKKTTHKDHMWKIAYYTTHGLKHFTQYISHSFSLWTSHMSCMCFNFTHTILYLCDSFISPLILRNSVFTSDFFPTPFIYFQMWFFLFMINLFSCDFHMIHL